MEETGDERMEDAEDLPSEPRQTPIQMQFSSGCEILGTTCETQCHAS